MYAEELDKLRLQLKDTQDQLHAEERAKLEQSSQKRIAESRAGDLANELAQANEDLKSSRTKLAAAVTAAEGAQVLQQTLNTTEDELKKTKVKLRSAEARIAETVKRNEKLTEDLAVASAHLLQNRARYEEAVKVKEAYAQRLEADLVISGSKL